MDETSTKMKKKRKDKTIWELIINCLKEREEEKNAVVSLKIHFTGDSVFGNVCGEVCVQVKAYHNVTLDIL